MRVVIIAVAAVAAAVFAGLALDVLARSGSFRSKAPLLGGSLLVALVASVVQYAVDGSEGTKSSAPATNQPTSAASTAPSTTAALTSIEGDVVALAADADGALLRFLGEVGAVARLRVRADELAISVEQPDPSVMIGESITFGCGPTNPRDVEHCITIIALDRDGEPAWERNRVVWELQGVYQAEPAFMANGGSMIYRVREVPPSIPVG